MGRYIIVNVLFFKLGSEFIGVYYIIKFYNY